MHVCNPWCASGFHAVLFESEQSEIPVLASVSKAMVVNAGLKPLEPHAWQTIAPAGLPAPGTPTKLGIVRAKVVAWGTGRS